MSQPPIRQCDIVEYRPPHARRRAVVISGNAFHASGLVLIAPIVNRREPVPHVELPLTTRAAASLFGLRPVPANCITTIVGRIEPEQLDALHGGLDVVCNL